MHYWEHHAPLEKGKKFRSDYKKKMGFVNNGFIIVNSGLNICWV